MGFSGRHVKRLGELTAPKNPHYIRTAFRLQPTDIWTGAGISRCFHSILKEIISYLSKLVFSS